MKPSLYIGVMSGTSLDGVDIALVDIQSTNVSLIASECYPIPQSLKSNLLTLCTNQQSSLQQLGEIDHQLGELYATVINKFILKNQIDKNNICAIGCHGQTLYHSPDGAYPFTMQIGDANIIAAKTNITTIADFRRKDMALGGQGAPLVPAFHQAILARPNTTRVILNIGGISNITVLAPNQTVIGYDTGPGNVLLDSWMMLHLNQAYDKDAHFAKTGHINTALLHDLLNEVYFSKPYPKSTGRELFNFNWLQQKLAKHNITAQDVQATLVELTVIATVNQLTHLALPKTLPCELLVCGGGAKNPLMMERFSQHLPDWLVTTTDAFGINSDYMEAMAFAWLAYCRIHHINSNIPSVTGAKKAVCLGVIYPNN